MKQRSALSISRYFSTTDIHQLRQMTQAARLHHILGERQIEIADKMGISQAGVSRLLRMAEEHGIIRKVVVPPEGLYPDLEDALCSTYNLNSAFVVDVGSEEDQIPQILGAAAARCLEPELNIASAIGFTSWSTTLREMARMMEPQNSNGKKYVIETLGDLGSPMLQHEADVATVLMAEALQAEPIFLRAPGVASTAARRDAALSDPHVRSALTKLDNLDIVLVGIGPAAFHGPLEENDNFFSAEQLANVRQLGAVGQLHQRFIDKNGSPIITSLDDLVIGITLDQLLKAKRRIAVAGGKIKHEAILAALAGYWINTIVTDVDSANYLLTKASKQPKSESGKHDVI